MRAPPCPVYNTAKRSGKAGFKLTLGVVKWLAEAPNQKRRDNSMNPAPMSMYCVPAPRPCSTDTVALSRRS